MNNNLLSCRDSTGSNLYLHKYYFISLFLFLAAMGLAIITNMFTISVLVAMLAAIIVGYTIYSDENELPCLSLIFWVFTCIYGLYCPYMIYERGYTKDTFYFVNLDYTITPFLCCYYLASIGFICSRIGVQSDNLLLQVTHDRYREIPDIPFLNIAATISALLCSLFEMVNVYRLGGLMVLFGGKAAFQANVSDLSLTLPSANFFTITCMLVAILAASYRLNGNILNYGLFYKICLLCIPFLASKLLLGQRGILAAGFVAVLISYSSFIRINNITKRNLLVILFFYLFMIFLYANRGIVSLLIDNTPEFIDKILDIDRYIGHTKLEDSEFGVAYLNFATFFQKYGTYFEITYGKSYIQDLVSMIPSFMYPGEKPITSVYAFRDEFFPEWALRSRIASTAYSSFLDAFINFGYIGVMIEYFLVGKFIKYFDYLRHRSSIVYVLFACSLSYQCIAFSRYNLGGVISGFVWFIIYIVFVQILSSCIYGYFYKNH